MSDDAVNLDELKQVAARLREEVREEYLHPSRFIEGSDLNDSVKTLSLFRPTGKAEV